MSNSIRAFRRQPDENKPPDALLLMFRQRSRLTQEEIARRLGFKSGRMLRLWEGGYNLPRAERLRLLIELYLDLAVFTPGLELEEAFQLWQSVKNGFEATIEKFQEYPIFDENWFRSLLKNRKAPEPGVEPEPFLFMAGPRSSSQLEKIPRHNLPQSPNPLVGREKEVARVAELLLKPFTRLLTLTGPGGTGKTRLSLAVGETLLPDFAGEVFFLALASTIDPEQIPPLLVQTLGVKIGPGQTIATALKAYLQNRQLLLILDNFEQLIPAGPLLENYLANNPGLKMLVTSRASLQLYNEQEFLVPPLALPGLEPLEPPEQLLKNAAIKLFVDRARLVKPAFNLTSENARPVAELCVRLDGLPLALELAAAQLKLFGSVQALLKRLTNRLGLLSNGAGNMNPHHQTIRDTVQWSYDLLNSSQKQLFRQLAIFWGSFSLRSVEESGLVNPDDRQMENYALEGLRALVNQSLVQSREARPGLPPELAEPRFGLLETIKEFALEKLMAEDGEQQAQKLRERHSLHFLNLVERAGPELNKAGQKQWLEALEEEQENLRAALSWTLENPETTVLRAGRVKLGLQLAVGLAPFWDRQGKFSEGSRWLGLALESCHRVPGGLSNSLSIPLPLIAKGLINAGTLNLRQGNLASAARFMEEALETFRKLEDFPKISIALINLGVLKYQAGEIEKARELYQESLALKRQLGDKRGSAMCLNNLGEIAAQKEQYEAAFQLYRESLALLEDLGDTRGVGIALLNLGAVNQQKNEVALARTYLARSLSLLKEVGDRFNLIEILERLAGISPDVERAARLFGFSVYLRQTLGSGFSPVYKSSYYDQALSLCRSKLDPQRWNDQWVLGQSLSLEQALGEGLLA